MKSEICVKRVYETPSADDGCRVLVDRLWPRGLTKETAHFDHWFKDLAPSDTLRKWFGHDPEKWPEFRKRYHKELDGNLAAVAPLRDVCKREPKVTLLFGAREERYNNAVALASYLGG